MTDRDNINRGIKAGLLFLLLATAGHGGFAGETAEAYFKSGLTAYESGDYETAAEAFEHAVANDPENSHYHHWLAKGYGSIAEQSSWFRAYSLAHRIRSALERAVELDRNNRAAIEDLAAFHEQAPAMVGGNPEKAESLRALLAGLGDSDDT